MMWATISTLVTKPYININLCYSVSRARGPLGSFQYIYEVPIYNQRKHALAVIDSQKKSHNLSGDASPRHWQALKPEYIAWKLICLLGISTTPARSRSIFSFLSFITLSLADFVTAPLGSSERTSFLTAVSAFLESFSRISSVIHEPTTDWGVLVCNNHCRSNISTRRLFLSIRRHEVGIFQTAGSNVVRMRTR